MGGMVTQAIDFATSTSQTTTPQSFGRGAGRWWELQSNLAPFRWVNYRKELNPANS